MAVRSTVLATIVAVAKQQELKLEPLNDALPLLESGLDSLSMAIIVARLEDEYDRDPFDVEDDFIFPVTIGEFVALYEIAVNQPKK
jgi:acyl carrier protein